MPDVPEYTVYVYSTTSGQILDELPTANQPQWSRQINDVGSGQISVVIGDAGVPNRPALRNYATSSRFSIAVCWGDFVCQAGPIYGYSVDDTKAVLTLRFSGLWWLFNRRLMVNPNWNPNAFPFGSNITSNTADQILSGTLPDIARQIIRNNTNMMYIAGSNLPIDIGSDVGGTSNVRNYPGYDIVSAGQRLQELTQVIDGPDVDFSPYRDVANGAIRHELRVGDPYLVQPGSPVVFDYGSSIQSIAVTDDGSNVATSAIVKGSGDQRGIQAAWSSSTALTDYGWPWTTYIDSSHNSTTTFTELQEYADADLAVYGHSVEQWDITVRANTDPRLGSYWPGTFGVYNVQGHPWIDHRPEGYAVRILGLTQGSQPGEVKHIVEGQGAW